MTSLTPPRASHLGKAELPTQPLRTLLVRRHLSCQQDPSSYSGQVTLEFSLPPHAPRLHINSISNTFRGYHPQVTLHCRHQLSTGLCLVPGFLKLSSSWPISISCGPWAIPILMGSRTLTHAQVPQSAPMLSSWEDKPII